MSKQVPWNTILLDEFIELGGLTETEEAVLRTHVKGHTRVRQSMELGLSVSTIDRTIATLKRKYDDVQPFSLILPPRK